MHRIKRPREPKPFRRYCDKYLADHPWPEVKPNPRDDWNAFGSVPLSAYDPTHQDREGNPREKLKDLVYETLAGNQHGLCAYCEEKLPSKGDRRIEHHHPKSDVTTEHCWMFDWENLLAVCAGGTTNVIKLDSESDSESGSTELHCDASKGENPTPILNPYTMPQQCLFVFDEFSGKLSADVDMCNRVHVDEQLVKDTIDVLQLNCTTLTEHRKDLALHYQQEYKNVQKKMRTGQMAKGSVRSVIAERWFGKGQVPVLFTTRRCLLGTKADSYITTAFQ